MLWFPGVENPDLGQDFAFDFVQPLDLARGLPGELALVDRVQFEELAPGMVPSALATCATQTSSLAVSRRCSGSWALTYIKPFAD